MGYPSGLGMRIRGLIASYLPEYKVRNPREKEKDNYNCMQASNILTL